MSTTSSLEGKIALVTGAAQGLGEAAARALAERGASILATDINEPTGAALAEAMRREGHAIKFLRHDVASERDWLEVVGNAVARFGKVDILVNNAGIIEFAPIETRQHRQGCRSRAAERRSRI